MLPLQMNHAIKMLMCRTTSDVIGRTCVQYQHFESRCRHTNWSSWIRQSLSK